MMRFYPLILGLLMLTSCVSNKKITLLQKHDVKKSGKSLPIDTVVRTYAIDTFQYKLQPNDVIFTRFQSLTEEEFDIFNSDAPQQNMVGGPMMMGAVGELIDEQGFVEYPVMGKVRLAGLTVFEAQDKLQRLANQYVKDPVVRVRLVNFRITILGEVKQEGSIVLGNNRVSMLEAIGLAGGLSDLADRSKVKLIRQRGGITEVQYVNLRDEQFINSPYFFVHQNDVIIVPPLKQRPFRQYFGQNLTLAVSTVSVILLTINLLRN